MRATLYQESAHCVSPRRWAGGLTLVSLAAMLEFACDRPSSTPAVPAFSSPRPPASSRPESEAGPAEIPKGRSIHYGLLARFAPDRLLGYTSGPLAASTSRFGGVAITEIERSYVAGEEKLELRIVDSSVNNAGRAPTISGPYEDEQRVGRPLESISSVGYVEFEKTSNRAHAEMIVAERLLLTLMQEDAVGTDGLERFFAALDVAGMARLVAEQKRMP